MGIDEPVRTGRTICIALGQRWRSRPESERTPRWRRATWGGVFRIVASDLRPLDSDIGAGRPIAPLRNLPKGEVLSRGIELSLRIFVVSLEAERQAE
ncbi:MAG: hypothetical protein ACI841_000591 [Planctomycetota bacterium]|jgi:hypothetical protein